MSWLLYQLGYNLACLVAPGGAWMGSCIAERVALPRPLLVAESGASPAKLLKTHYKYNLIEQETTLSPPETSFTDLESLNLDKRSPETLHLSVPSDTEVLMEIDKSSTNRPATDNVQEAAKILKPLIRTLSGGIQTTKEVDVMLLSKKGKSRQSYSQIKYNSEKPKGSP
ncbi:hypothetical protein TNIN_198971 [Trichonephila inaurata madagascariensis]|uniref:Uncharacterized protein n=1 Tax=Trichonephila inaurata madagascariensis TaxID=2747483 RepID=A0A8X6YUW3_9ARAC|nr:hypothetical protein TNIN_198971 [Trichonephila inaurata madagascariensis]